MITILLTSFFLILLTVLSISYFNMKNKYKTLFNKVNDSLKELDKPLRLGYYKETLQLTIRNSYGSKQEDFEVIIYVDEIARYTNGDSKIRINSIDSGISSEKVSPNRVKRYISDGFKSLVKTSDIEWLENESEIKEIRRNKLEHLKQAIQNE